MLCLTRILRQRAQEVIDAVFAIFEVEIISGSQGFAAGGLVLGRRKVQRADRRFFRMFFKLGIVLESRQY